MHALLCSGGRHQCPGAHSQHVVPSRRPSHGRAEHVAALQLFRELDGSCSPEGGLSGGTAAEHLCPGVHREWHHGHRRGLAGAGVCGSARRDRPLPAGHFADDRRVGFDYRALDGEQGGAKGRRLPVRLADAEALHGGEHQHDSRAARHWRHWHVPSALRGRHVHVRVQLGPDPARAESDEAADGADLLLLHVLRHRGRDGVRVCPPRAGGDHRPCGLPGICSEHGRGSDESVASSHHGVVPGLRSLRRRFVRVPGNPALQVHP
mmetsp:Transcript_5010/g.20021  ORF Transcript_5010/g.20021 Transcript_5010/m.20021 type:complete len:264 (-) Transcript_5010:279-1070(-)